MNDSTPRPTRSKRPAAQWLPAIAAAGLLGTVVVAGVALGGGSEGGAPTDSTSVVGSTSTPPLTVPDSIPPVTVVEDDVVEKTSLTTTLTKGMVGDEVEALQTRLAELGFAVGPIDGQFGELTRQAVWAYEKLILGTERNAATGQVTDAMWQDMQDPFTIQPRRPNATRDHVEVYLPEQVMAIFHDDRPVMITHISSGDGEEWCEEVTISPGEYGNEDGEEPLVRRECGVSVTPGGVYQAYRQVEGRRESALGGMLNPVYFNYGIAIHGAFNVPLQPASHGCIRIANDLSAEMQELIEMGDQVYVWDGEKEPEHYGDQPPRFNWIDPEWLATSTTSTTSTTTTTTTTVAPSTTAPATAPATTRPPRPSSTTVPPATTTVPPTTAAVAPADESIADESAADASTADASSADDS